MGSNILFVIYLFIYLTNSNPSSTMMHERIKKNNNKINITYARNLGKQKDSNYNITSGVAVIMILKQ